MPEWIGALDQLQYLDLNNNQLTTLPERITDLNRLEYLNIGQNPNLIIEEWLRVLVEDLGGEPAPFVNPIEIHIAFHFTPEQLASLIDLLRSKVPEPDTSDIKTFIKGSIDGLIVADKPLPRKPVGYYVYQGNTLTTWGEVWEALYATKIALIDISSLLSPEEITLLRLSLLYVLEQPESFRNEYINCFLTDSTMAYPLATMYESFSCPKGVLERLILSIRSAIITSKSDDDVPPAKRKEYQSVEHKLARGFDEEEAKSHIEEWANENKVRLLERKNPDEQRRALIEYVVCKLTISEAELMEHTVVKDYLEYVLSEDYIKNNNSNSNSRRANGAGKWKRKSIKPRASMKSRKSIKRRAIIKARLKSRSSLKAKSRASLKARLKWRKSTKGRKAR